MRAAYIRGFLLCAVLAGCFAAQAAQAGQLADDPDAPWIPGLPIANSFAGIVELDSDPSGAEATTSRQLPHAVRARTFGGRALHRDVHARGL